MPLCAKCHQKEATVHLTSIVGEAVETNHFCKDCAPLSGLGTLDLKQAGALSVAGKKCEFCGLDALLVSWDAENPVYWCHDCRLKFQSIVISLVLSEHPELAERIRNTSSFAWLCLDPEFQALSSALMQKALQKMRS
jgi:hypothetical protein